MNNDRLIWVFDRLKRRRETFSRRVGNRHDQNQTATPLVQVQPADAVCVGDDLWRDLLGGYQLNWIRQRHEFVSTHRTFTGYPPRPKAPWPLSVFGEEGFLFVFTQKSAAHSEMGRAQQLFPEAKAEEE
jgi:hypothetical protein